MISCWKRPVKSLREKKISLDWVVDQKLKEFVFDYQKKKGALEGLEAFYRKCQAKVGAVNWRPRRTSWR